MSLPASTPQQQQEEEGISSSAAARAILPALAAEQRCTENDRNGWRCKKPRRMGNDDVYYKHHYADNSSAKGCSKSRVWVGKKRAKKDDWAVVLPVKKSPWLAFSSKISPDSFKFVSMDDGEICTISLPKTLKTAEAASSYGSLISTDNTKIFLLDPFTRAEVRLPPLTLCKDGNKDFFPTQIGNLVFSPSSSTGLVICFNGDNEPFFFSSHVGGTAWTLLGKCTPHKCNIIIHKAKFYTVESYGSLISFDPAAGLSMSNHGFSAIAIPGPDDLLHLVESIDGVDLLLVHQEREEESWKTLSFRVYKQDKDAHMWRRVKDMGDVAIFVGGSFSACILAQGLPNLRGNRVYFTVDVPLGEEGYDYGVFDLGTWTIDEINIRTSASWPSTFWIMPSVS